MDKKPSWESAPNWAEHYGHHYEYGYIYYSRETGLYESEGGNFGGNDFNVSSSVKHITTRPYKPSVVNQEFTTECSSQENNEPDLSHLDTGHIEPEQYQQQADDGCEGGACKI